MKGRVLKERTGVSAVEAGIAETVRLARKRGSGIEAPSAGARRGPYRRLAGLDWLDRQGRITAAQKRAGTIYGAVWRRAHGEFTPASSLDVRPGGGGMGPDMTRILGAAELRLRARDQLARMRQKLGQQAALVAACDQVCGAELTPREAAGGEREAGRLEAVLLVALDLLSA